MKIAAKLTINIGQYEDIRPEIIIDTENLEETKDVIIKLWDAFHGLVKFRMSPKDEVDSINADLSTRNELNKTDWHMQDLFDKVRKGEAIPVEVWQKLSDSDQNILHKAQLQFNQEQRLNKKDAKVSMQFGG